MLTKKAYKKYYQSKSVVQETFARHKKLVIVFLLVSLFCLVFAVSTIIQNREQLTLSNLFDKNLYLFLINEGSLSKLFVGRFLNIIFITLLIFSSHYFLIGYFASIVLLLYEIFKLIFDYGIIVLLFGLKGFLFFAPNFVTSIIILTLLLFLLCYSVEYRKNSYKTSVNLKVFLFLLLIIFLLLTLEIVIIKIIFPILLVIV